MTRKSERGVEIACEPALEDLSAEQRRRRPPQRILRGSNQRDHVWFAWCVRSRRRQSPVMTGDLAELRRTEKADSVGQAQLIPHTAAVPGFANLGWRGLD